MELYVVLSGMKDSAKRWENDLIAQFYPIYRNGKLEVTGKDPEGRDIINHRRLLVAPVQLYKIAFAKEELQNVLSAVCPTDYVEKRYSVLKYIAKTLRKFLGLKPVPTPKTINPFLQPNQVDKAVTVFPIGIKEDMMVDGWEMI